VPKLTKRLTDSVARALPLPVSAGGVDVRTIRGKQVEMHKAAYEFHWCKDTPGFGVRVSSTGDKAYVAERRVNGETKRRTLGKAVGSEAISADAARKLQIEISSELQAGTDRSVLERQKRKADKAGSITFGDALRAYVKGKRRAKDGLALKKRTQDDYLKMLEPGGTKKNGEPRADGMLFGLAEKPLHRISAEDIRKTYSSAFGRGERQGIYAMQVLRAVLNWHGVTVENSPLDKTTAGRDRIVLPGTSGSPKPIPPERLGAWWRAATQRAGSAAADGCRFVLLTGCRPGEAFGDPFETGLLVENVDLEGARATFLDTKNRTDHTVMLSTQALEIVKAQCKGKRPAQKVFDVLNPGKTLRGINAEAGVKSITPHKLRHTFASVAEELVSGYALKRMMNHADGADVTGAHYVGKSETQLRNAWQAVADFIEESGNTGP
jgi:integrase